MVGELVTVGKAGQHVDVGQPDDLRFALTHGRDVGADPPPALHAAGRIMQRLGRHGPPAGLSTDPDGNHDIAERSVACEALPEQLEHRRLAGRCLVEARGDDRDQRATL